VTVAAFNVLHGLFCPAETDACRAPVRAALVARVLEEAGCPHVVGFQEVGARQEAELPGALAEVCGGRYRIAWNPVNSPDREMVVTALPILDEGYLDIANFPWEAYWVRVRSGQGPIDFLTAHFASSSNNPPCNATRCPAVCPDGITTNECHAREVVEFFSPRKGAAMAVVAGDLNATIGSPTLTTLTDAGFEDAWLAAGNEECDPATGAGCTSDRERPDNALDGLDSPDGRYSERIDFVLARGSSTCAPGVERAEVLAGEPFPEPVDDLYWASDHAGVLAALVCT
jgi:hypothetical protein